MKRYITYSLFLIAAAWTLVSCEKFLEDDPSDRLPDSEAYNTVADLRNNALGAIYLNIGGSAPSQGLQGTARGVWDLNTFSTDEAIIPTRGTDWYDGGIWQNLFLHRFGNVDFTGDTWNYLFKEVLACNRAIERIGGDLQRELLQDARRSGDGVVRGWCLWWSSSRQSRPS